MTTLRRSLAACLLLSSLVAPAAYAQTEPGVPSSLEPRQAVGTILMAGLVGGILGLSTLSFYEMPQDNIRNITIGAGVGIIGAALFLTYSITEEGTPSKKAQLIPVFDGERVAMAGILRF